MKKFKLIVPSFVAILVSVLLIAGSTFALFTSSITNNISVGSATVKVNASFDEDTLKVYSAKAVEEYQEGDDIAGTIDEGPFAGNYIFDLQDREAEVAEKTYHLFANNDAETATGALLDGDELSLINMTPGDKVKVTLSIGNSSNVDIKYRVKVNLVSGLKLFEGLKFKLNDVLLQGVAKAGSWKLLQAGEDIDDIKVEVLLPLLAGNDYQTLSTKLNFTVEAVQANAKTVDEVISTNIEIENEVEDHTEDQVISDNQQLVTVTVPAAELDDTVESLSVSVKPQDTVSNITITSEQAALSYDVKVLVTKTTSTESEVYESNENTVTVRMFIGKGLKGVKLYHKANEITDFDYDAETGYIEFETLSFSEYTVLFNKDYVVETVTSQGSEFTTYKATETAGVYTKTSVDPQTQQETVETVVKVTDEDGNTQTNIGTGEAYIDHNGEITFKTSLRKAIEDAAEGDTIVLVANSTSEDGYLIEKNLKLNTNGYIIEVEKGTSVKNRAFKVDNESVFTVYGGGTINALGAGTTSDNGTGCYGAFRIEVNSELRLSDVTLTNARPWGLNVKVLGGKAYLNNVTINSQYGGGIEVSEEDLGEQSQPGYAELTNCHFTQTGYFDWCSSCISVSGGSELLVNGGLYTTQNAALYVFSSGGYITVNSGTFEGKMVAAIDTYTYPEYEGGIKLNGGNYTGTFDITSPASLAIKGGTYNINPSTYVVSGYYAAQLAENKYEVLEAEWHVKSIVANNDKTEATVTYELAVNPSITRQEQVRYLTARNVGSQHTDTTFDVYCGETLVLANTSLTCNMFYNSEFQGKKNILEFPACDIYYNGDSYNRSDELFIIGAKDANGNPLTNFFGTGNNTGKKGLQDNVRRESNGDMMRICYFENIVFDGANQLTNWGHLFTITSYDTYVEFKNVVFKNLNTSKTSVVGIWANQKLVDENFAEINAFPTSADKLGVIVKFTNCKVQDCNNKPVVQFQGFTSDDIASQSDCYSFIKVVFDGQSGQNCGLNSNAAFATQGGNNLYDFGQHYYWAVNGKEVLSVSGSSVTVYAE